MATEFELYRLRRLTFTSGDNAIQDAAAKIPCKAY